MRVRSPGAGSDALRGPWRRWTAIVELFARRRRARRRVDPRAYTTLHQGLLAACLSLADSAGEESRAYYEGLEAVARPWLSPKILEHADSEILDSLLVRCLQIERELGGRSLTLASLFGAIKALLGVSALAGAIYLLTASGFDLAPPLRGAQDWADRAWWAVKRASDTQKLFAATVLVVIVSISLVSRMARA